MAETVRFPSIDLAASSVSRPTSIFLLDLRCRFSLSSVDRRLVSEREKTRGRGEEESRPVVYRRVESIAGDLGRAADLGRDLEANHDRDLDPFEQRSLPSSVSRPCRRISCRACQRSSRRDSLLRTNAAWRRRKKEPPKLWRQILQRR